jgi:hypothetical protein
MPNYPWHAVRAFFKEDGYRRWRTIPSGGPTMRDAWFAGAGIVFGWLMSKAWSDPGCQVGMVIFLVTTAVLTLAFALAVVGHGRGPQGPDRDDDDDRDR